MHLAVLFGVLTGVFFLLFLYHADLILCYLREEGDDAEYRLRLEKKHKKAKHPQKKNFLLYLICLSYRRQGEEKKAKELSLFLKNDFLLGVKKEAD